MSIQSVLLVDDDPIQNMINSKLIARSSFKVDIRIANNGQEAIELLEATKDNMPDVIFLDINMPIISGWDFLDFIIPKNIGKLPRIYMLTSSISPDDIRRSENHPIVQAFLTKPLSVSRIDDLFRSLS